MTRSMLRAIRVTSKQELIARIHLYFAELNADPVIFRWKYMGWQPFWLDHSGRSLKQP